MHYSSLSAVDFSSNWEDGLLDLLEQLEKQDIPKREHPINPLMNWFKAISNNSSAIERAERYRSNWLPFDLPDKVFVHSLPEPVNKARVWQIPFPKLLVANYLIGFFPTDVAKRFVDVLATTEAIVADFQADENLLLVDGRELRSPKGLSLIHI